MNRCPGFLSVVFPLLLGAQCLFAEEPAQPLTVDQAIAAVVKRNPSVRQARLALEAAQWHTNNLKTLNYPVVNASLSDMYLGPEYPFTLGPQKLNMYPDNNFDAHVGAEYIAYDFGKRQAIIDNSAAAELAANDKIAGLKADLSYQVRQFFMTIIMQEKSLSIADSNIAELDRHLDVVKKKIETGSATEYDVLKTEVQRATARGMRIDILNDLRKKRAFLNQLMGLSADAPLALVGAIDTLPFRCNGDSLYKAALAQRSDYALATHSKLTADLLLKAARLENMPVLGLHASAGFKNGFPDDKMPPDISTPRLNWALGGQVSVPIYDGNKTRLHVTESERLCSAAEAGISDKEEHIKIDLNQALADVDASFARLDVSRTQVNTAARGLELARLKYDAGVITNLDVLDAANDFLQAQLAHLQDQFRFMMSVFDLDKVTGRVLY